MYDDNISLRQLRKTTCVEIIGNFWFVDKLNIKGGVIELVPVSIKIQEEVFKPHL